MPESNKEIEEGKIWAFIGYWWILFLVPLLGFKDNKFALFHGKQGLVLFVAFIADYVIMMFFSWIPVLNILISGIVCWLLFLTFTILAIIGMVKSFQGIYWKMPVLGDIAEKIKI